MSRVSYGLDTPGDWRFGQCLQGFSRFLATCCVKNCPFFCSFFCQGCGVDAARSVVFGGVVLLAHGLREKGHLAERKRDHDTENGNDPMLGVRGDV